MNALKPIVFPKDLDKKGIEKAEEALRYNMKLLFDKIEELEKKVNE